MLIVVFKLGEEHFADDTERVQGLNDMMLVTRVPKSPSYLKGLINLRGSIKSLVDINMLLNIESEKEQKSIIILKIKDEEIGISVDEVEEVLDIEEKDIHKLVDKPNNVNEQYIKGIVNMNGRLLTIIDIDSLLN